MSRSIDADALKDYFQSLAYDDWNQGVTTSWADAYHECADIVEEQPTITPERKQGRWVEIGDEPYDEWECDVCGFVIDGSGCIDPEEYRDVYNYCPNCGAAMQEGET